MATIFCLTFIVYSVIIHGEKGNIMSKNSSVSTIYNTVSPLDLYKIIEVQAKAIMNNPQSSKSFSPLMIWGAPGCGKSTIIRSVAENLNIGFVDLRLSEMEPIDLRGVPVPNEKTKSTEWFVTSELPRDEKSFGIILFDELSAADRSLQVAAYEIILDRRLSNLYKVPDGWMIVGAGNRTQDRAVSMTMSSALANRFCHVELETDYENWTEWATANDIHPSVVGFINFMPHKLFNQEGENLERGFPTPRSWQRVSEYLKLYAHTDEYILRKLVYGLIGPSAGVEFMEFYKLDIEFQDVLSVMKDSTKKIEIPEKIDRKYALCATINYLLWKGEDEVDTNLRLEGFFRYACEFTPDFSAMLMINAMSGSTNEERAEHCKLLYHHPMYKEWSKANKNAFAKRLANRNHS